MNTTVHPEYHRLGIGLHLVRQAVAMAKAREVECLHVDFEPRLQEFYEQCGFKSTKAGLINLKESIGKRHKDVL